MGSTRSRNISSDVYKGKDRRDERCNAHGGDDEEDRYRKLGVKGAYPSKTGPGSYTVWHEARFAYARNRTGQDARLKGEVRTDGGTPI